MRTPAPPTVACPTPAAPGAPVVPAPTCAPAPSVSSALMCSESSDDPSSHVTRSNRSTKTRVRTLASAFASDFDSASLRNSVDAM